MTDGPTTIERVPQLFSLAVGVFGVLAVVLWQVSVALGVLMVVLAVGSFALRIWTPIKRRRRYGY